MAFAILKLSYNQPGDSSVEGGICGSGFFINSRTAVTAHHCLNNNTFRPNTGFRNALFWIITRRGLVIRIDRNFASLYPDFDTTIISFRDSMSNVQVYECAIDGIVDGLKVLGIGHIGNSMPPIDAEWQGSEFVIKSASLAGVMRDMDGFVKPHLIDINGNDVRMHCVLGLKLSFCSYVGMSGGPVVDSNTGKVIGMLSYGLPRDSSVKTETFAVSINEILSRCM